MVSRHVQDGLFTRFVGEHKLRFFDKLTVEPMSSESAAVAAGDAPRDGIQSFFSALSVRNEPQNAVGRLGFLPEC